MMGADGDMVLLSTPSSGVIAKYVLWGLKNGYERKLDLSTGG